LKEYSLYALGALAFSVLLFFLVRVPNDTDNFYHLAHAGIYAKNGLLYRPFPWAALSVISNYNADLWWGFHILLVPITFIKDLDTQLLAAPCILVFLHLLISGGAMMILRITPWFGFVTLTSTTAVLTRMDTVRPQCLSAAILIWIFASLVGKKPFLAILGSLLLGFVHPTLSYMLLPLLSGFLIFSKEKSKWWTSTGCLLSAMSLALVRPGWKDGLSLMKIQLIDLFMVRRTGQIKNFGAELDKVDFSYFMRGMAIPIVLLIIAAIFALRSNKKVDLEPVKTSLLFSFLTGIVCIFMTRRGVDQFAPFATLSALLWIRATGGIHWIATITFAASSMFGLINFVEAKLPTRNQTGERGFRPAAEWLAKNTPKGTLVGTGVWSDFGPMLYYNSHNRYFGGMDPIFQFKRSKADYWRMSIAAPGRDYGNTGPDNPLALQEEEPVSIVFPRDLKARYLVINIKWNLAVANEIRRQPAAKVVFEDTFAVVFEFKPTS
jgi:hypothetical protein